MVVNPDPGQQIAALVDEVLAVGAPLVVLVLDLGPLSPADVVDEVGHVPTGLARIAAQRGPNPALDQAFGVAGLLERALLSPAPEHDVLMRMGLDMPAVVGHGPRIRLAEGDREFRYAAVGDHADAVDLGIRHQA